MEIKERKELGFIPIHEGKDGVTITQSAYEGHSIDLISLSLQDLRWLINCAQECLNEWAPTHGTDG